MSAVETYIERQMSEIPGWIGATDARIFSGISQWQQETDVAGDLLEIGVYKGRSAVLLGYLVGNGERLVLCDLFDDPAASRSPSDGPAGYVGHTLDRFLATYQRHHGRPPVVYQCASKQLGDLEMTRGFRMIHIDGSHAYAHVRADIELLPSLLVDGGIAILDDYRSLHTPGVSAAVWEAVANGSLRPICLSPDKMYATWGPERLGTRDRVRHVLATVPGIDVIDDTVCGHHIFVVLPKGYGDDSRSTRDRFVHAVLPPVVLNLHRRFRTWGSAS